MELERGRITKELELRDPQEMSPKQFDSEDKNIPARVKIRKVDFLQV